MKYIIDTDKMTITPYTEPINTVSTPRNTDNIRNKVVEIARSYIGKIPYLYGGKDKNGIDCSGFVQMVLREAHVDVPKYAVNSTGMREWGKETRNPRPGDIICYNGHVAIYSGDNKIIDAGSSVKGITERSASIMPFITIRDLIGD